MCSARPSMSKNNLGKVAYSSNQTKYSFTNSNAKGGNVDLLEYDVDFKDNFHSLDHEMTIEDVMCKDSILEIRTTTRDIEQWGNDFYISGTTMWNCKTSFNKKVTTIQYKGMEESLYVYELITEEAKMEELFKTAKINFVPNKQNVQPKRVDIDKEVTFKQKRQSKRVTQQNKQIKNNVVYADEGVKSNITKNHFKNALKRGTYLTITSPEEDSIYFTDYIIPLKFDFNDGEWDTEVITSVDAYLKSSDVGISYHYSLFHRFESMDVTFEAYLVVPDAEASDDYYITVEVEYTGGWFSSQSEDSEYIQVNVEPEIVVTGPTAGEIIDATSEDYVVVTWECSTQFDYDDMEISLRRDIPFATDDTIYTKTISNYASGSSVFYFSSFESDVESGSNYYFEISYDCNVLGYCSTEYSERFTIYANTDYSLPVQITSPTFTTQLETGDTLTIQWTNTEEMNSKYMNIEIYQDIFGLDPKYYTKKDVLISTGELSISLTSAVFPEGNNYYVYITYNCDDYILFDYCDSIESERFSIDKPNEYIQFDSIDVDGLEVTIKYTMLQTVPDGYFTIKEDYPNILVGDPVLDRTKYPVSTQTSGITYSIVYTLDEGSAFRLYVSFSTNCLLGDYLCTTEYSKRFDVPLDYDGLSWNYDSSYEKAEGEISFFDLNCSTCDSSSVNPVEVTFCKACNAVSGVGEIEFSATCDNCYAANTLHLSQLVFDYGLSGVLQASVNFTGHTTLNIDLSSKIEGVISDTYEKEFPIQTNTGYKFSIGPLDVNVGLTFSVVFTFGYEFEGLAELSASYSQDYDYSLVAKYPANSGDYISYDFDKSIPTKSFDFGANAAVTVNVGVGAKAEVACQFIQASATILPQLVNYIQAGTTLLEADQYSDNPHYGYLTVSFEVLVTLEAEYDLLLFADKITKEFTLYEVSEFFTLPLFEITSTNYSPVKQTLLIDESYKNLDEAASIFVGFVKELAAIVQEQNTNGETVKVCDVGLEPKTSGSTQNSYTTYDLTSMVDVSPDSVVVIFNSIENQDSVVFSSNHPYAMKMKSYIGTCQIENCETCSTDYETCSKCIDSMVVKNGQCVDAPEQSSSEPTTEESSNEPAIESSSATIPEESSNEPVTESSSTTTEESNEPTIESSSATIPEQSSSEPTVESSSTTTPEESSNETNPEESTEDPNNNNNGNVMPFVVTVTFAIFLLL
ncbi:hypothetical protein QTN25_010438 [Entamoeba marina]